MTGRPSIRTDEMIDDIISRLAKGEPLAQICRDDGMPHPSTFYDWRDADESLSQRFARAREDGFDAIALDALHIADENGRDTRYTKDGQEVADSEWITRSRLRVETRLKLLAKWDPKRYGEKLDVNHSGQVSHRNDLSAYSADELDTLEALVEKGSDAKRDQGGTGTPEPGSVH